MAKITISVIATTGPVGPLYQLVDNLNNQNSEVSIGRSIDGLDSIIDDSDASAEQKMIIDEVTILDILAENGQIENYLFGIRQPSASATTDIPVGVPSRTFILGAVKNFSQWFASNADVWSNNVTDEIIYFNSPNPSDSVILTASESELIRQLDPDTFSFMTVDEVLTEVALPNWIKL